MNTGFHRPPPTGSIVVTMTEPLFGGQRDARGDPHTHFTVRVPGTFASVEEARGFIARLPREQDREYAVEIA